MANSKGKGSNFERVVCRMITKWITGVENPVICWRSSNSGGTFTVNRRKGAGQSAMAGDLCSIDEASKWLFDKFSIECKVGYPGANPLKIFKGAKNDDLRSFWTQANGDAKQANKTPILIFKPNQGKILIGITEDIKNKLNVNFKPSMMIDFESKFDLPKLCLFDATRFFDTYTVDIFRQILNV